MFFKRKKLSTFSYFIPAPPSRKTGYQEKELDTVLNFILSKGFSINKISTESITTENGAGVWVFTILQAETKEAESFNLNIDYQDLIPKEPNTNEEFQIIHES